MRKVPDHAVSHITGSITNQPRVSRVNGQQGRQVRSIKVLAGRPLGTNQRKDGWIEVEPVHHDITLHTSRNIRPDNDEGDPRAPFFQRNLAAIKRFVVGVDIISRSLHATIV